METFAKFYWHLLSFLRYFWSGVASEADRYLSQMLGVSMNNPAMFIRFNLMNLFTIHFPFAQFNQDMPFKIYFQWNLNSKLHIQCSNWEYFSVPDLYWHTTIRGSRFNILDIIMICDDGTQTAVAWHVVSRKGTTALVCSQHLSISGTVNYL